VANVIKHKFTDPKADQPDATLVRPSNWNDEHAISGGTNGALMLRDTGATDGGNWLAAVAAGQVLISQGAAAAPVYSESPTVRTVRFLTSAPASPATGDFWIEITGVTPTGTITSKFRVSGTTVTLFEVPF
jgi:hypothetical protein